LEIYSNIECKWIPKEDLWQTVRSFREKYWTENTLPVDMEKIVEQRLRLSIEPIHSLLDDLDVDAFLKLDLSGIVVDYDCFMQERFQNRIRFSFAHEVGHFVLHKDIYEKIPFTSLRQPGTQICPIRERSDSGTLSQVRPGRSLPLAFLIRLLPSAPQPLQFLLFLLQIPQIFHQRMHQGRRIVCP
jgi:hypothetical protein